MSVRGGGGGPGVILVTRTDMGGGHVNISGVSITLLGSDSLHVSIHLSMTFNLVGLKKH